jgi:RND family efflux transporter MFP subunit
MLSLPLRVAGDLVGVTVLEREAIDPFPAGAVPLVRLVAEFIGPAVWTKRMADRGVLAVARDRAWEIAAAAVGPRHTGFKSLVLLIGALLVCSAVIPIPDRVTAESETKAAVSRTIPPPFTGFLDSIAVKPGDQVKKGNVMATMDLHEVMLDLEKARSKLKSLQTQQGTALGEKKYGEAAVASAQIEETQADIALLDDHLAHGEIRAPISGIVSRGDMEQLRGARVEPTQPLFEIVEPDALTVTLDVKERDIGRVTAGQTGSISLTALPGQRQEIRVTRIRPSAEAQKKGNVYLVDAEFTERAPWVKPGMTGTSRLRGGSTTALGYLLRPIIDAARMRLWW